MKQAYKITKEDAARVQLETAIKLFFENKDILSPYTLMAAAEGILDGIWKNESNYIHRRRVAEGKKIEFTFRDNWSIAIKEEYRKEGRKYFNRPQNFFKHADRDHDEELEFAGPDITALRILTTIADFELVFGHNTKVMRTFSSWCWMFYPNLVDKDSALFQHLQNNPYAEQCRDMKHEQRAYVGMQMLKKECPELFFFEQTGFVL